MIFWLFVIGLAVVAVWTSASPSSGVHAAPPSPVEELHRHLAWIEALERVYERNRGMFGYDPEAIYQDADIEMREMEEIGNRISRLRKQGVCTHEGWRLLPTGGVRCTDKCGKSFDTEEGLLEEREALIYG